MADNVTFQSATPATPPAATVVSTEEVTTLNGTSVSAQHVQRAGLALITGNGTAVDAPGSSTDGVLVNLGANNDVTVTASALPTGAATAANQATANTSLNSIDGKLPSLSGGAVPVSAASLPLPSGAATAAKQPALGTAGTPSTDVLSVQGVSGGTALPVSDGGGSLTVDGTFWQATQPTKEIRAATPTQTSVAGIATNVTLLASNTDRLGATIYNDSSAVLYVKLGVTASATSFTVLLAGNSSGVGGYYEVPFGYTGQIDGLWASATGAARITELT